MAGYDIQLHESSNVENRLAELAKKIDDFQVIILYDRQPYHFDYNYLVNFPSEKLKKKIDNNSIFPRIKSETFIIRQQNYEENFQLFYKLRVRARNEMLSKMTEFMTAKFFSTNERQLAPLLKNKPTLKWEVISRLFAKYETMLHSNTRLQDEQSWNGFSRWFKDYLMEQTLDEIMQTTGYDRLAAMDNEELNKLFFEKLNGNFSSNDSFMNEFTKVINIYVKRWISEVLDQFESEKNSMKQITSLLDGNTYTVERQYFESITKSNNLLVMSNPIYQFITEAISNHQFSKYEETLHPTAVIATNLLSGTVQAMPVESERMHAAAADIQELAGNLSELDVDVLDSLCHMYLSKASNPDAGVLVRVDDLLEIRGLKTKLSGTGRRGGYEKEQRIKILKALSFIQSLWIDLEHVSVYENGRQQNRPFCGRAFHFTNSDGSVCSFDAERSADECWLRIGEVFGHFLKGSGRQVKLLPSQAVEYNPYQNKWEKKLIRYLSWRWRTQARKASYLQPHKISTLLEKLGVQADSQAPSRIRDRMEKALDQLADDGIITYWQYESWDESSVSKKGWLRVWQNATLIIAPPDNIIKYYQPIEQKKSSKNQNEFSLMKENEEVDKEIGLDFKEKRKKRGLTLQQVSDELRISISYLSNIERGGSTPSYSLYKRMRDWIG